MAPKRIGLIGQPHWTAHLERVLNRHAGDLVHAEVLPLRTLASWRGVAAIRRLDVLLRVGFRPGAPTWRGVAFDSFWTALCSAAEKAARVFYWIGSDVVRSVADAHAGRLRMEPMRRAVEARHLAGAPWFVDELAGIGIAAQPCLFPTEMDWDGLMPPLPAEFRVMTYIPDGRQRSYGAETIYQAAAALPMVPFSVVGGNGMWVTTPLPNLVFHGWQELRAHYAASSVLVRLVAHDGLGATVREAMALGRHVVYTYPIPFTNTVRYGDTDGLITALKALYRAHCNRTLRLNIPAAEYAKKEFDAARTATALAEALLEGR